MNRLGADVRFVLTSFLEGVDALSLLSINSSWQQLFQQERICRLLYTGLFGECTERDMDIFEWNAETTWAFRLSVRSATMRNRRNGHVINTIKIPVSDVSTASCMMDGSMIDMNWLSGRKWFDIRKQAAIDAYSDQSDLALEQWKRSPRTVFKNPYLSIRTPLTTLPTANVYVTNTKTGQDVAIIGQAGYLTRIECDPASDLVLISNNDGDDDHNRLFVIDICDGKRYPVPDAYCQHTSSRSILYNGRLFIHDTFSSQMHILDAKSGQVIATSRSAARCLLVGVMPCHVVIRDTGPNNQWQNKLLDAKTLVETTMWDHARDAVMDFYRNELMIDQTFVLRNGSARQWTHVDVRGKQRMMNSDFVTNRMNIMAFNSRWLLMADGASSNVYDFMPPRTRPAQQGAKRYKTN